MNNYDDQLWDVIMTSIIHSCDQWNGNIMVSTIIVMSFIFRTIINRLMTKNLIINNIQTHKYRQQVADKITVSPMIIATRPIVLDTMAIVHLFRCILFWIVALLLLATRKINNNS